MSDPDIERIVEEAMKVWDKRMSYPSDRDVAVIAARRAAELAVAKERERFNTLIQNTVNILNEDGKYAILCEKLSAAIRAGKEASDASTNTGVSRSN